MSVHTIDLYDVEDWNRCQHVRLAQDLARSRQRQDIQTEIEARHFHKSKTRDGLDARYKGYITDNLCIHPIDRIFLINLTFSKPLW